MLSEILENLPSKLDQLDLSSLQQYGGEFTTPSKVVAYYKLLAYFSTHFSNQTIYDIGTMGGSSAVAFSYNSTVKVVSYDIVNNRHSSNQPPNVEYRIGDFRSDLEILKSPLIFIDVSPHDGVQEEEFHKFFIEHNYKGYILLDDVKSDIFPGLRDWFANLSHPNIQTHFIEESCGNVTGTGVISYNM